MVDPEPEVSTAEDEASGASGEDAIDPLGWLFVSANSTPGEAGLSLGSPTRTEDDDSSSSNTAA
jgi:hypothetical protein